MSETEIIFKLKADFLKALSHPLRLAIIEQLKNGKRSVGQLVAENAVEQSSISKNLAILKNAGILTSQQEGVTVYYSIRDQDIFKVLRVVSDILSGKLKESGRILQQLGRP